MVQHGLYQWGGLMHVLGLVKSADGSSFVLTMLDPKIAI